MRQRKVKGCRILNITEKDLAEIFDSIDLTYRTPTYGNDVYAVFVHLFHGRFNEALVKVKDNQKACMIILESEGVFCYTAPDYKDGSVLLDLFSSGCVTEWFGPVKYLYSNGLDDSLVSKIVEETGLSVFR